MTDIASLPGGQPSRARSETALASPHMTEAAHERLRARYRSEQRFKVFGIAAVVVGLLSLVILLLNVLTSAFSALWSTEVQVRLNLDPQVLFERAYDTDFANGEARRAALIAKAQRGEPLERNELVLGNWRAAFERALLERFPVPATVQSRAERREYGNLINQFISNGGPDVLIQRLLREPGLMGQTAAVWLPTKSDIDMVRKGWIDRDLPPDQRSVRDVELRWMGELEASGDLRAAFNTRFFTGGNSSSPEFVGIWGAVVGSFFTLFVTVLLAVPVGVMAAIYLEEFAPKNGFTDFIEVNINNLAAVPSIVFGLLGLAVFLSFFGMPRSAPLVGGIVMALMSLPVIIIATRAALRSVPPSIRQAALGIGASKMQVVTHHVLPLAAPGILTGTIIAMANALGETAPLLMIGMNAFLTDVPAGFLSPATVIPVQVFSWSRDSLLGFQEKTALAIVVLLVFLLAMNAIAIYLRRKFERRW